jgi:hypothetical protein
MSDSVDAVPSARTDSALARQPIGEPDALDLSGKVLAIAIALLPAAGVLTRLVAFAAGGLQGDLLFLAWSAPVGQLMTTAVRGMLFPAFTNVIVLALFGRAMMWIAPGVRRQAALRAEAFVTGVITRIVGREGGLVDRLAALDVEDKRLREHFRAEVQQYIQEGPYLLQWAHGKTVSPRTRKTRIPVYCILLLVLLPLGALVLLAPVVQAALLLTTYAMGFMTLAALMRRGGTGVLSRALPGVAGAVLLGAMYGGYMGLVPGSNPEVYAISQKAGVPQSGQYQRIAQSGKIVYLVSCGKMVRRVVGVNEDEIISVRSHRVAVSPRAEPSVLSVIYGGDRFGLGLEDC